MTKAPTSSKKNNERRGWQTLTIVKPNWTNKITMINERPFVSLKMAWWHSTKLFSLDLRGLLVFFSSSLLLAAFSFIYLMWRSSLISIFRTTEKKSQETPWIVCYNYITTAAWPTDRHPWPTYSPVLHGGPVQCHLYSFLHSHAPHLQYNTATPSRFTPPTDRRGDIIQFAVMSRKLTLLPTLLQVLLHGVACIVVLRSLFRMPPVLMLSETSNDVAVESATRSKDGRSRIGKRLLAA